MNGDGTPGHLNGLGNQASAYDTGLNAAGDTWIDILGHAIAQAEDQGDFEVDGIMNRNEMHVLAGAAGATGYVAILEGNQLPEGT